MSRRKARLMTAAQLLLMVAALTLLLFSLGYKRDGPTVESVCYVNHVTASVNGGPLTEVELPYTFRDLEPRTPVTIRARISPSFDDSVYIKTVYSPAKVFFDGRPVFEFGKKSNYPAFMLDPATEIHMIETYGSGAEMELELDFLSPVSRRSLVVHPPMVGTSKELIMERSRVLGIPLVFSLVQIVAGISLILISACIVLVDKQGIMFFWLGLFSLATGVWSFGENNFSSVIFRDSTTLYLLSFIGLFTFMVPLLRFTRTAVEFRDPRPLWYMELLTAVSACTALILQLLGLVSCSTSMYFFHALLPLVLIITTVLTVREAVQTRSISSRRFIFPVSVLAVTAVAELLNYRFPLTYVFSSLFQLGILVFLLVMGVTAGLSLKGSIDLRNRQKELAFEKGLMEIQIKEQKERGLLLAQKEQLLRRQRHDLRHQLTAIQDLAWKENEPLQEYLRSLMDQIPTSEEVFCENRIVNAVISHYAALCGPKNIEFSSKLVVPDCKDATSDSELCVIFGNLLENAVEACDRMEPGLPRFIKLRSSMQYDLLTITMDNSFNGQISTENGRFRSAKRDDFGVGLASVRSMAQKSGGDVEFTSQGNVFLSSVYLRL